MTDHSEKEARDRTESRQPAGLRRETRADQGNQDGAVSEAQLRYLSSLIIKVSKDRFNAEFTAAIKGTSIAPRR